jgi:hypothetical protein
MAWNQLWYILNDIYNRPTAVIPIKNSPWKGAKEIGWTSKEKEGEKQCQKIEEIRLQRVKTAEAGESEPKCAASCGQEGHLRSSSKSCPNYSPKPLSDVLPLDLQEIPLSRLVCRGAALTKFWDEISNKPFEIKKPGPCRLTFCKLCYCQQTPIWAICPTFEPHFFTRHVLPANRTRLPRRPMGLRLISRFPPTNASYSSIYFWCWDRDGYKRAAALQFAWRDIANEEILQNTFDERVRSISLGPTPITEANLYAKANMYLPFLYTVLTYMDNQVHILDPVPQDFATKGYVRRELHEISYLIVDTWVHGYWSFV